MGRTKNHPIQAGIYLFHLIHFSLAKGLREIFIQEAREITAYIKDIHHSRKISHQQVNYPETVQKLSNILSEKSFQSFSSGNQLNQPMARTETDFHKSMNLEARTMKLKEHQQKMIDHMKAERHINERKRLYNREIGRKAVVNQVQLNDL